MNQQLPSDKLKATRRPWRAIAIITAIVVVGVTAAFIAGAALTPDTSRDAAVHVHLAGEQGKPTTPQMTHKLILTTHVAKTEVPPPPPPAPENYYGGSGPVQCPYGTTANAVDAYGNESNCQANGPGNAQCVAYDANNNCTQYYKP